MKAKSEVSLVVADDINQDIGNTNNGNSECDSSRAKYRSRSLEDLTGAGAMWSSFVREIVLLKGDKGLGFSILDYQVSLGSSFIVESHRGSRGREGTWSETTKF